MVLKYDSSEESELVRAFALDIVPTDGVILDINDFVVGPDNGGYGIFPGSFSRYIDIAPQTGEVEDWNVDGYSPVVDGNDPGALPGLGSYGVTIEMGSLYDTNAPGPTGTLCSIRGSAGMSGLEVKVNEVRGGVVLENGEWAAVDLQEAKARLGICDHLYRFPWEYSTFPDWEALGEPQCWLDAYQCDGDADGKNSDNPFKYRVFLSDLSLLVSNWKKKAGDPSLDPCADFDHRSSGPPFYYRVFLGDLNILTSNWKKRDSELPGDCPRPE